MKKNSDIRKLCCSEEICPVTWPFVLSSLNCITVKDFLTCDQDILRQLTWEMLTYRTVDNILPHKLRANYTGNVASPSRGGSLSVQVITYKNSNHVNSFETGVRLCRLISLLLINFSSLNPFTVSCMFSRDKGGGGGANTPPPPQSPCTTCDVINLDVIRYS